MATDQSESLASSIEHKIVTKSFHKMRRNLFLATTLSYRGVVLHIHWCSNLSNVEACYSDVTSFAKPGHIALQSEMWPVLWNCAWPAAMMVYHHKSLQIVENILHTTRLVLVMSEINFVSNAAEKWGIWLHSVHSWQFSLCVTVHCSRKGLGRSKSLEMCSMYSRSI